MTLDELELEFDIQYNNISSNQAPGLTPLEKSIFLTQAQEAVVKAYYGDTNGFEKTEEVTEYLRTLVDQKTYTSKSKVTSISFIDESGTLITATRYEKGDFDNNYYCWSNGDNELLNRFLTLSNTPSIGDTVFHVDQIAFSNVTNVNEEESEFNTTSRGIVKNSKVVSIPDNLMFITYESAVIDNGCSNISFAIVEPVKQDEFFRIYNNPFRGPSKTRVLRLLNDKEIELVSKYDIKEYLLRYIKFPEPIVLNGASEYGVEPYSNYPNGNTCQLPESIHRTIVTQAVALAKAAWS